MSELEIINDELKTNDHKKIIKFLNSQSIDFGKFKINSKLSNIVQKECPTSSDREILINSYSSYQKLFCNKKNFRSDVVCFYPNLEDIDFIITKFGSIHFHFENEYWYFLDGEAIFGFLSNDGTKFQLKVKKGEYLQVPEGCWQWFSLTPKKRMKAIRFFYSDDKIKKRKKVVL